MWVIYLKIFKKVVPANDGYQELKDNLQQTTQELRSAYINLENVVDPDLIDYYIYQTKAIQTRYRFLLNCVKQIENT